MHSRAASAAGVPRRHGYGKGDRLRKRFEFRSVRLRGRRVHTRSFVLLVAASRSAGPRLGLTVSKRVGNAVRRNRVKRLLREVFRTHRDLFPAQGDLVVIAKTGCEVHSKHEVFQELRRASAALKAAARSCASAQGGDA